MLLNDAKRNVRRLLKHVKYPRIHTQSVEAGETVKFYTHNAVEDFRILQYGGERDFLERFVGLLRPDDILFDIGASVGLITVHAARALGGGRVFSFEPDPETCGHLIKNVRLNGFQNVEMVTWAASDTSAEVTLFTDGADGFAPSMRKQVDRKGAPKSAIRVWSRSLDEAIENGELPAPSVLKIDIEGAELLCLRGAKRLLQGDFSNRPRLIFIEVHPEFLPDFGATADDVYSLLEDMGYSALWEMDRDAQAHGCYFLKDSKPETKA